MSKTKVKYCSKCGKRTVHNLICKEHVMDDFKLGRIIWALGTLGLSESIGSTSYYQCSKCENIRKED